MNWKKLEVIFEFLVFGIIIGIVEDLIAVKKFASPSEGAAEGGCGGNSAAPEQKTEASPAACSVRGRAKQNILFPLEEKIGRAQKEKCEECFAWRRVRQLADERRRGGFIRRGFPENGFGFRSGYGAILRQGYGVALKPSAQDHGMAGLGN